MTVPCSAPKPLKLPRLSVSGGGGAGRGEAGSDGGEDGVAWLGVEVAGDEGWQGVATQFEGAFGHQLGRLAACHRSRMVEVGVQREHPRPLSRSRRTAQVAMRLRAASHPRDMRSGVSLSQNVPEVTSSKRVRS